MIKVYRLSVNASFGALSFSLFLLPKCRFAALRIYQIKKGGNANECQKEMETGRPAAWPNYLRERAGKAKKRLQ